MLLLLLQAYGSMCLVQPQRLHVEPMSHPQGSFSVLVRGGAVRPAAQELANRFRLRDSSGAFVSVRVDHLLGEVRFTPQRKLAPGSYLVEMWADFDGEGRRMPLGGSTKPAQSVWFPYLRYEVTEPEHGVLEAPSHAVWRRFHNARPSSAGEMTILAVEAEASPGTRVEVEVRGVGAIGATRATAEGRVWLRLGKELCSEYALELPRTGDLRVRLVSVGEQGARRPGPWVTLGPSTPVEMMERSLPSNSAPSGMPAPVKQLPGWVDLSHQPEPGPTQVAKTSCGRLVRRGKPLPMGIGPHEILLVDADQVFRRVVIDGGQLRLDGVLLNWVLPRGGSAEIYLAGVGESLTLGVHDTQADRLHLLRVQGATVVEQAEVPGVDRVTGFDMDRSELHVAWNEGEVRWMQRFDAKLVPKDAAIEVLLPIRIGQVSDPNAGWGIGVNGHVVKGLERHHFSEGPAVFDGLAYLATYGNAGERVTVARPDGTLVWSLDIVEPLTLRRLVVNQRAVHLLLVDLRGPGRIETVRSFTHAGVEIVPALEMPTSVPSAYRVPDPPIQRLNHGGRTVLVSRVAARVQIGVEEQGRRSPLTEIPTDAIVAVRPNGVEVVWTGRRGGRMQTWKQELMCSGESLGVPEMWPVR